MRQPLFTSFHKRDDGKISISYLEGDDYEDFEKLREYLISIGCSFSKYKFIIYAGVQNFIYENHQMTLVWDECYGSDIIGSEEGIHTISNRLKIKT